MQTGSSRIEVPPNPGVLATPRQVIIGNALQPPFETPAHFPVTATQPEITCAEQVLNGNIAKAEASQAEA